MDIVDRFRGCLLGLAAGDALVMPVEGYTSEEIKAKFGEVVDMMPAQEGHFHAGLEAGQYTDDTLETLLLAESMIESSGFSAERFSEKLREWGNVWHLDESASRGAGLATKSSVESLIVGTSWKESGAMIPTCGSAMRTAPIGMVYRCDLSIVSGYANLQSLPTHCSPAARAGSVAVAVAIALCINGFPKKTVLHTACNLARKVDKEFADRLAWIESLLGFEPEKALAAIGNSPEVSETVPAAFYCFLKFTPEEGLIAAASGGGDTDSIASIAGSLFGALEGSSWIPERWLTCLESRERIEKASEGLANLSAVLCGC